MDTDTSLGPMESEPESEWSTDDDESQEGVEKNYREDFETVLKAINLDPLPGYASQVRKALDPNAPGVKRIGERFFGSWHMFWPVIFEDGVKWLFKVAPFSNKGKCTYVDSANFRTEALTMRLLRRETTIPIPEVFDFNPSCDNEFNCAFMLIGFMEGKELAYVWFDMTSPKEVVQRRRTRALQGIAAYMAQLDKYSFDKGGFLLFDDQDRLSGIGPALTPDLWGVAKPQSADDVDYAEGYVRTGPLTDPKEYFTSKLYNRGKQDTMFKRGAIRLLRMFFDAMPTPYDGRKPFVLAHPNLSIDNFLVSEEGEVMAVLDWENVMAVPRTLGNERLPDWLTLDWHPWYEWTKEMGNNPEHYHTAWTESPKTLKYFRSVYASAVWSCQHHEPSTRPTGPTLTSHSLIYDILFMAAASPPMMMEILRKVFGEIKTMLEREGLKLEVEGDDEDAFTCYSVEAGLGENRLSEHRRSLLMRGFQLLLQHSHEL